ncbi:hydroxymethylglutaryl-CoA synthase [Candidatus Dojkabacteria bacterium]|uniref:Hydroxymethylglutaryl-CoA synthase n=1 Tax=Candidatus Dojkabacteria bacterium TaxID=2099670 RepID=A0A955L9A7_9BACT|nr:hydroxymethylglutaryl-CoA synthase [Candidatus Dojkabacteria bacterium]
MGIVSYGAYIPPYRITVKEIARTWGADALKIEQGLGLIEKSVPGLDEDTATNAVNAAFQAIERFGVKEAQSIGAIYVGSESHPYAVKPTAGIVGEALNIGNEWTAADLEFACKAGTAGIQAVIGLVESKRIKLGLAIGADTAQGAPGDALEYSAASAGAAFLLGTKKCIAKVIHTTSYTTDTPDFWRREHVQFPKHGGRFTGKPAYEQHVLAATQQLIRDTDITVEDVDHVVFHMPNGKFPKVVAKKLGVTSSQLEKGFVVPMVGNSYSASSLVGLASVLDSAQPGEKILLTSYGSGAGSDSFLFEVTDEIVEYREKAKTGIYTQTVLEQTEQKSYLTYGQYVRHTKKLR